ncbi:MAG: hypothetical protein JW986_03705 [Methanotrichaceae archaeon]|nr:hypothetical protein [Methanotrichaceae archaeon]
MEYVIMWNHRAPLIFLSALMMLVGVGGGHVSTSFSASDGQSSVGFSTTYGADGEYRIEDTATASFSSGVGLSRSIQSSGDLNEYHWARDDMGNFASVRAEVENAVDNKYQYAIFPAEGDVISGSYVQARHKLTSLEADRIYCEEAASNAEGDWAVTSTTVEEGSLLGYYGLSRASAVYATANHCADHANGRTVTFTLEAGAGGSCHAYNRLTARDGGVPAKVDGYRGSAYEDTNLATASIREAYIDLEDGNMEIEQCSSILSDSSGSWTTLTDGQLSFAGQSWASEEPKSGTSIDRLVAQGEVCNLIRGGDFPWKIMGMDGRFAGSITYVDGYLNLIASAKDNEPMHSLYVGLEALGSIQQCVTSQDAWSRLSAKSATSIDLGYLSYSIISRAGESLAFADLDLFADAMEGGIVHGMYAGGKLDCEPVASASGYGEDTALEDRDPEAVERALVEGGTLQYSGRSVDLLKGSERLALIEVDRLRGDVSGGVVEHAIEMEGAEGNWAIESSAVVFPRGSGSLEYAGLGKAAETFALVQGKLIAHGSAGSLTAALESKTSLSPDSASEFTDCSFHSWSLSSVAGTGDLSFEGMALAKDGLSSVRLCDHRSSGEFASVELGAGDLLRGGPGAMASIEVASGEAGSLAFEGQTLDRIDSMGGRESIVTTLVDAWGDDLHASFEAWGPGEGGAPGERSLTTSNVEDGHLGIAGDCRAAFLGTTSRQRGVHQGGLVSSYGEAEDPVEGEIAFGGFKAVDKGLRFYTLAWTDEDSAHARWGSIHI